ncbi:unnamed protein product [Ascophyllum nodosum]
MWSMGVVAFNMLSGKQPFVQNRKTTISDITRGRFDLDSRYWSTVSKKAKDFIRALLTVDTSKRLTAERALEHSWLRTRGQELARNDLSSSLDQLRLFNAKRKLRASIHTVVAAARMEEILREENAGVGGPGGGKA